MSFSVTVPVLGRFHCVKHPGEVCDDVVVSPLYNHE